MKEPLLYRGRATLWRTGLMIGLAWTVGGLIGFCSVYSGIYTTAGANILHHQRGQCEFEVMQLYLLCFMSKFWSYKTQNICLLIATFLENISFFS